MGNKQSASVPKYELVKQYILNRIQEKSLLVNDKIPSENELARLCSVSVITARKALNDLASEGFVYRIKGKGSFAAMSHNPQDKQRLRIIEFLLPASGGSDNSFMQMIRGAQACCAARGYPVMIGVSNDDLDLEHELIDRVLSDNLAGILIYSIDPEAGLAQYKRLRDEGVPFVLLDRYSDSIPLNVASSNNMDGGFQATEYLIRVGHRKILFASYHYSVKTEQLRRKGYQLAMQAYGIEEDASLFVDSSEDNFPRICHKIRCGEVTAVVCANDHIALQLLDFLNRHDISVPDDVSLVGFDGIPSGEFVTPPLTTVRQDFYSIGETAAKILMELLEHPTSGTKQVLLPTQLLVRASTAPPKEHRNRVSKEELH